MIDELFAEMSDTSDKAGQAEQDDEETESEVDEETESEVESVLEPGATEIEDFGEDTEMEDDF